MMLSSAGHSRLQLRLSFTWSDNAPGGSIILKPVVNTNGVIPMNFASHLLGDILVGMTIISKEQLEKALELQQAYADKDTSLADPDPSKLIPK